MARGDALLVLTPFSAEDDPGPPAATPLGAAALALRADGVRVLFGDDVRAGSVRGLEATPDGWMPATATIAAVYDRFPSQSHAARHVAILSELGQTIVSNPPALVELCRDKVLAQRWLAARGVPMPPIDDDPATFGASVRAWGAGFVKPRYGAFGVGVVRVEPGRAIPARVAGLLGEEPAIVQQAVPPPQGWTGVSVRVLVQRTPDGRWARPVPVARASRTDPVVNVSRGANVHAATALLGPDVASACERVAEHVARALAEHPHGERLVEVGVDVVPDPDGRVYVIEVNGRPRGRLGALARRDSTFAAAHRAAAVRPLVWLAHRAFGGLRGS
jgi:glutathione synthase/RimK-type ligase-like ATP-grasp enzyme